MSNFSSPSSLDRSGHIRDSLYLLVYSLTGILALIGNLIVVKVVVQEKRMRTFVHLLLANMALSDVICALSFFLGLSLCSDAFILSVGGSGLCVANKAIQLLSFQVSSVTMVVVAVDRLIAVFFPFYHKRVNGDSRNEGPLELQNICWSRAFSVIVGVWFTATVIIIATSPSLGYQRYFSSGNGDPIIKCELAKAFDIFAVGNSPKKQRYLLIVANLAHFWIPFTVICVAYGSIVVKVWRRSFGEDMTKSQADLLLMQRWKTIKMLMAAVTVFMSCWLPFFIFNIVAFVSDSSKKRPCNQSVVFLVVIWLAFSSCNPFIYWIYNETYRKGIGDFLKLFKCPIKMTMGWGHWWTKRRATTDSTAHIKHTTSCETR